MKEQYEVIKGARELLSTLTSDTKNGATKQDYVSKIRRLTARCGSGEAYAAIVAEALKTRKKTTWQANRAALKYVWADGIAKLLEEQDKLQRANRAAAAAGGTPNKEAWIEIVGNIEQMTKALKLLLEAKLPREGRENRHTKRLDMKGLPPDWRERIIARMPKYADQALVAAVTGCRPVELVSGVELTIDTETGGLVAMIKGAKISDESGQEWRRMCWAADTDSPLVSSLAELVGKHPAGSVVRIGVDNAKAFSGAMRAAGKREWPKRKTTVTPYCMRHQAAADMKAVGTMSSGDISAALGHVSDVTKSTYGHANMGRKRGGVAPKQVEAARPVQTKTPSKAARKVTKQVYEGGKGAQQPSPAPSPGT